MHAMILAAGRGSRLRPLTDTTPKPLLLVDNYTLIEHCLFRLKKAGYTNIVINVAYLGQQIIDKLGNGHDYGVRIEYSNEGDHALETGGGITNALTMLGTEPFLVVNADIWTDHPMIPPDWSDTKLAHLVLIDNPVHNLDGDFHLKSDGFIDDTDINKQTFSGIGWYHPDLFRDKKVGSFPLAPILRNAIKQHAVTAEHYKGTWIDIGTQERLALLRASHD